MSTPSYRSISSRKSDRQRKYFEGSDSSESKSDSEDNFEEDFDPSDSDSYDSDHSNSRKKKAGSRDEEKGSGNSGSDDDDNNSLRSSETDKDSCNSNSSSDSDDSRTRESESKIARSKLLAIGLTVVCVILLLSAVGFSVSLLLGGKGGGETELETSGSASRPTDAVTSAPTPAPSESPTAEAPSLPPIPMDEPSSRPTLIIYFNDNDEEEDDDDEFMNDFDVLDGGIPENIVVTPNGDTYVVTLLDGTTEEEAGSPPFFGSSQSLLIQGRNNVAAKNDTNATATAAAQEDKDDDGFSNSTSSGNGNESSRTKENVDATSYALLNFYMGDNPWYQKNSDLVNYDVKATVCLEHVVNSDPEDPWGNPQFNENGEPKRKIFSICRLENSVDMMEAETEALVKVGKVGTGNDVETISSNVAEYSMPEDCMGGQYKLFYVATNTTTVCSDVTPFVQNFSPFVREREEDEESSSSSQQSSLDENRNIRRRFLQPKEQEETEMPVQDFSQSLEPIEEEPDIETPTNSESETATPTNVEDFRGDTESIVDASNYKNMLFMIANVRENQDASARFYSREDVVNAPIMFLTLVEKAPTVSPSPTDPPTGGSTRSTVAPSASQSPTTSPAPTYEAEFTPCGMCGNFPSFVPLKELELSIPLELAPPQIASSTPPDSTQGKATCNEFETLCLDGYCTPQLCAYLQTPIQAGLKPSEFCGCLAPVQEPCGLCEDDEILESPNTLVDLEADQAPLGEATTMTCASLEGSCQGGFCSPGVCESAQNDVRCGCRSTDPSTAQPSAAPSVSMVPTASLQPSFKAEFERCSICGDDPINFLRNDVNVKIPADITPPQVTTCNEVENEVEYCLTTCIKLESYCEGGYCSPRMCLGYQQSLAVDCGCSDEDNIFEDRENAEALPKASEILSP
jgi:hypothetical protein